MSELISGKEALIALANGKEVEYWCESYPSIQKRWTPLKALNEYKLSYLLEDNPLFKFRLKPQTTTLSLEIPAPFEPKDGDIYYFINSSNLKGYGFNKFANDGDDECLTFYGAWRTEEEIRQVVSALRSVFKPQ